MLPTDLDFHGAVTRLTPLILIVDDHEDSRVIGRILLENAGFRVAEARTGSAGLHAARELLPTVVLLDIVLPEIDGWDMARLLRSGRTTKDIALIAVTALAGSANVNESLLAGCDEVLIKPVPPSTLLATLARYIGPPPNTNVRLRHFHESRG